MNENDAMDELLELSNTLAGYVTKAMQQLPEADRSFTLAVVTFHRMSAHAALCMGMSRENFLSAAAQIYDGSLKAMEEQGTKPVKH